MADKMVDVRYTGTASWSRVILGDNGKFSHRESVAPNAIVSLPEDIAKALCGDGSLPESQRNFVLIEKKEAPAPGPNPSEVRKAPPSQGDRKN